MTLAEAILIIENKFIVHHEVGYPIQSYDQQDKAIDTGAVNASMAPCGEPYVTITSGGLKEHGDQIAMWFASESKAVYEWHLFVLDYAAEVAPSDEWMSLHLYWRQKPEFTMRDYVAVDQAAILQAHPERGDEIILHLGTVWSRLLITKTRPDGSVADG